MATELAGTVQSGDQQPLPLAGATVNVYEATLAAPIPVGNATTAGDGTFSISIADPTASTFFYAVAQVSGGVALVTIIGRQIGGSIVINELTTVAAAFSMAQFTDGVAIAGNTFGLRMAALMNGNLVDTAT
ncbi:MAG TPA: hypothetical protein VFR37_20075, partial [Longimicrobium sp.]|nr:hypothetical protein [Longimicrobium sp.]